MWFAIENLDRNFLLLGESTIMRGIHLDRFPFDVILEFDENLILSPSSGNGIMDLIDEIDQR